MNLLITGGTGFIGSRLALKCKGLGHDVKVFGMKNTPAEEANAKLLQTNDIEILNIDISNKNSLIGLLNGIDIVFHLAAVQHEMNVPDKKFWDVNVEGTKNLIETSVDSGVQKFIHGSTIGVYGNLEGEIDEKSPCKPDNIYGKTKLKGEKVVYSFRNKIKVTIIRIPETYGPGDHRLIKLFKLINRNAKFTIGNGKNLHHSIFIEDLVEGLILASENNTSSGELFLFSGGKPVSTEQIYETIAGELGKKVPNIKIPYSLMYIVAYISEMIFRPLGIQPPIYRRRIDFFKKSFFLSSQKARSLIQFDPQTSFKEGIKQTADWYKQQGFINS